MLATIGIQPAEVSRIINLEEENITQESENVNNNSKNVDEQTEVNSLKNKGSGSHSNYGYSIPTNEKGI